MFSCHCLAVIMTASFDEVYALFNVDGGKRINR
ncbi:hypothetical protein ERHA55_22080 [Erwinia rhapontici]|nr:hypothetical protein ERHA55_22080 [Erwinia rhapontici]